MRKIIALFIMVGLLVGLFFYFTKVYHPADQVVTKEAISMSEESLLPEIKEDYDNLLLKVRKLQKNPDQIAELNCIITKLLYSGKLTADEVKLLAKFQREFYTQKTLDKNPEDANYEKLQKELDTYKVADLSIIGYKIVGPQYIDADEGKNQMLIFNIIYYLNITTDDGEVYKSYIYEQNESGLWELKGFGDSESFPII